MLRCRTCNAWLGPTAETCPRCGTPRAAEDAPRPWHPVLVFFAFFAIGLIAYAVVFGLPEKPSREPRPATAVSAPAVPDAGAVPRPETTPAAVEAPVATEDAPATEPPASSRHDGFAFDATLTDPDGVIVLQSKATMFSKNVAKLASGTRVRAARRSGEWIRVQTRDGRVGYVRRRQLVFR